jgi:N-acetylmuramoyl-L-alanine amidase
MVLSAVGPAAGVGAAGRRLGRVIATWLSGAWMLAALASAPVAAAPDAVSPVLRNLRGTRLGSIDYVKLTDAAAAMGLRVSVAPLGLAVFLKAGARPVARFVDRAKEADVEGLRVFLGDPVLARRGQFYISRVDLEHALVAWLRPDLAGPPPRHPRIIVLDPGHGGEDKGKINDRLKLYEKTLTLDTAKRLQAILQGKGYTVRLTRTQDRTLALESRPALAGREGADLFISLHFNGEPPPGQGAAGIEDYRQTPQFQVPMRRQNLRVPADDDLANPSAVNDRWNSLLAFAVLQTLRKELPMTDRGLKHDHDKVLQLAPCPAILIEGGFLSNEAEAHRLADPQFRQRYAEAVARGIEAYAATIDRLRAPEVARAAGPAPLAPAPAVPFRPTRP